MNGKFAAVILAAGYSSRMGDFKPLLPVGKMTAVERLIKEAEKVACGKVIVVTGFERDSLLEVIESAGGMEVYNRDFDEGMFTSIKTGVRSVCEKYPEVSGVFLMPVDCPLVSTGVLRKMADQARSAETSDDAFLVPVFEGKKGHPLYIPRRYFDEICSYDGSGGLKAVTDKYWDKMIRIPVDEEGCVMDMDTHESYMKIIDFLGKGCRRESLLKLAEGRRFFLIRHGQTKQHREKMFIGQYDIPLNEEGKLQIRETSALIAEQVPKTDRLYTSPLSRAAESASIVQEALGSEYKICEIPDLTEINLGKWDGRPVREIKEKYPEEYSRRGRDIFVFKTGNRAENFYDVQYRAVGALREILLQDSSEDIIIVSHSAVMRALENNLRGMRVDDDWNSLPKGSFRIISV